MLPKTILIAVKSKKEGYQRVADLTTFADRISVADIVTSSFELFSVAKQTCPEIIIADAVLSDSDSLPVLLKLRKQGLSSRILILSESKSFEEAYAAIQCHADYFLLYPIDSRHFLSCIHTILNELESQSFQLPSMEYRKVIGRLFLDRGRITMQENHFPVEIVNNLYDTHFQDESYRMVDIFMNKAKNTSYDKISELLSSYTNIIYNAMLGLCYEIIMRFALKRVHILLNYSADKDIQILSLLEKISNETARFLPGETSIVLCCSNRHDNIQDIEEMAEEAMDAVWISYSDFSSHMLLKSNNSSISKTIQKDFDTIEKNLKCACYELNLTLFQDNLSKLSSFPHHIIKQCELRHLLRRVEYYMLDTNRSLISSYTNINTVKQHILQTLQMSNSLDEYIKRYSFCLTSVFQNILNQTGGNQSKHIRLSIQYILERLDKKVSLKEVAEYVGFSPNYYSTLFKKETGYTFSDFIKKTRIDEAKKLLADTTLSIKSIASAVGFYDSRYFNRVFKSMTGMNPSEFRIAAHKKA